MRPRFLETFLAIGALLSAAALGAAEPPRWQKVRQHGDVPPPVWEAGVAFARVDPADPAGTQPDTIYRSAASAGPLPPNSPSRISMPSISTRPPGRG